MKNIKIIDDKAIEVTDEQFNQIEDAINYKQKYWYNSQICYIHWQHGEMCCLYYPVKKSLEIGDVNINKLIKI